MVGKNANRICSASAVLCLCLFAYFKYSGVPELRSKASSDKSIVLEGDPTIGHRKITTSPHRGQESSVSSSCTAARSIVFVKTHKTGGTSIKTVLEKHRDKYLKVDRVSRSAREVKCSPCPFYGGYPGTFKARFANVRSSPYVQLKNTHDDFKKDVLFGHLRFNKNELQTIMSPDAKYITILRNPYKQFQSTFQFFYGHYTDFVDGEIEIACRGEPFLQVAGRFGVSFPEYLRLADRILTEDMPWFFRSKNYQSYELGLDPMNMDGEYIMGMARELDSAFDLVMITDYFLESLILMKDTLCISWSEMVGKYRNKQAYQSHSFTTEETDIMKRLFKQDFMIYEYFNRTFWRKVDKYGWARMEKDKRYLKRLMEKDGESVTRKRRNTPDQFIKDDLFAQHSREQHINIMVNRIVNRTYVHKRVLNHTVLKEMARYMYDNRGSCPR